jgi:hypothetical protein
VLRTVNRVYCVAHFFVLGIRIVITFERIRSMIRGWRPRASVNFPRGQVTLGMVNLIVNCALLLVPHPQALQKPISSLSEGTRSGQDMH